MNKYTIRREVVETIEVIAPTGQEAIQSADETPIDLWTRAVKSEEIANMEEVHA